MWDEIIFQFPNFNDCAIEVWECISNFIHGLLRMWYIHAGVKVKPC